MIRETGQRHDLVFAGVRGLRRRGSARHDAQTSQHRPDCTGASRSGSDRHGPTDPRICRVFISFRSGPPAPFRRAAPSPKATARRPPGRHTLQAISDTLAYDANSQGGHGRDPPSEPFRHLLGGDASPRLRGLQVSAIDRSRQVTRSTEPIGRPTVAGCTNTGHLIEPADVAALPSTQKRPALHVERRCRDARGEGGGGTFTAANRESGDR